MPRIKAPTVAEHRARQRRAILTAAREHLATHGSAPSLAEVGARAGLARSSVYQYFTSRDDLLAAVVAEVFPEWTAQVLVAMESAATPGEQVWAYVGANIDLFAGSEQAVASTLRKVVDPSVLQGPMHEMHRSLQQPLVAALRAHGEETPEGMADIIDAMLLRASRDTWSADRRTARRRAARARALLRRVLGPYLGLEETPR